MGISLYLNYSDWRTYPGIFTLPILLITTIINVGLVSYFLLPAVRIVYFNKRLRWWETKPRYEIDMQATLIIDNHQISCTILNISEGGALVKNINPLQMGFDACLRFSFFDQTVNVPARVVYSQNGSMGFQFLHNNETEKKVKKIIRKLRLSGVNTRERPDKWTKGFQKWAVVLLTTGKGLLPVTHTTIKQ
jgi:hypothetical protein